MVCSVLLQMQRHSCLCSRLLTHASFGNPNRIKCPLALRLVIKILTKGLLLVINEKTPCPVPGAAVWKTRCLTLVAALMAAATPAHSQENDKNLNYQTSGTTGLMVFDPGLNIDVEPILPLPLTESLNLNPKKVALGEKLFKDKSLSADGKFSCETCHLADKGMTDQKAHSPAIDGKDRDLNTPTMFNIGEMKLLTWSGKRSNLGDVAEGVIKSKKGLAIEMPDLVKRLDASAEYKSLFGSVYTDGIQADNVKDAMAEYMRSLNTPNSRFDKYLRGDTSALSKDEREGYHLFKEYGCSSCHQGVNIGGNMMAPAGIFGNFIKDRGNETTADLGLFNKTGNLGDKYVFRVPTLRNIDLTHPYLHDGSADTLEKAVDIMGRYMLGRDLPVKDIDLIVKFLKTLTGEFKGNPL